VFCLDLRTNSDLCHLQHKVIGFYNRDEKCLLRGADWVFKYNSDKCSYRVKLLCDIHTDHSGLQQFELLTFLFALTDCFIVITVVKIGVAVFRLVTSCSLVGDIDVSKERKVCLFWRWQALTGVRDI